MTAKTIYYTALGGISTAGALIADALGGWDTGLQTLVALMAVDYVTGVLCALVWKKSPKTTDGAFESKTSFKGLLRKMTILLCVLVACRVDSYTGTYLARNAVILFFIVNDGLSIVENLGIMGVPIPPALKNAFEALKNNAEVKKTIS